jgi:hypothetical protein
VGTDKRVLAARERKERACAVGAANERAPLRRERDRECTRAGMGRVLRPPSRPALLGQANQS